MKKLTLVFAIALGMAACSDNNSGNSTGTGGSIDSAGNLPSTDSSSMHASDSQMNSGPNNSSVNPMVDTAVKEKSEKNSSLHHEGKTSHALPRGETGSTGSGSSTDRPKK